MILYKVLAYVGSIWSLLGYISLLGVAIAMPALLSDIMPILEASRDKSFVFFSSLLNFVLLLGIVGTAISITAIIATKKIKSITKTLPIILIIAGIVFIALQGIQYGYMEDVFGMITEGSPYYGTAEAEFEDKFFGKISESFVIGIIPGILLVVSGMLAFRIYRKPSSAVLGSK